jgi:hypothetical protein
VLLYVKPRPFDDFVRLLDDGTYSHASIYNGKAIVEALPAGVVPRPLETSILHATVVDVFRLRVDDDGRTIGEDPAYPPDPVLHSIATFEALHDRYAYDQLILLSILCLTRKIHLGAERDAIVREVLDSGAEAIARIAEGGREPMICSELVYRCFAQAGPRYRIKIRGLDDERIARAVEVPAGERHALAHGHLRLISRRHAADAEPAPETSADSEPVVADFVTPRDLETSPNLERIGRLKG